MRSEEFDKMLRSTEAAHGEPRFEEAAWEQMEKILDVHLPVEKKKRRGLLLPVILLTAAVGIAIAIGVSADGNKPEPAAMDAGKGNASVTEKLETNQIAAKPSGTINQQHYNKSNRLADQPTTNTSIALPAAPAFHESNTPLKTYGIKTARTNAVVKEKKQDRQTLAVQPTSAPEESRNVTNMQSTTERKTLDSSAVASAQRMDPAPATIADSSAALADKKKDSVLTISEPLAKKSPASTSTIAKRFAFSVSVGPDVSRVGLGRTGDTKIQFGAGISYDLNSRLTIRTGFYAARKIYTADSSDYHPPSSFWSYYSNLQRIDANCLVFEIPVGVMYHFKQRKKHNWFATAGLSSFIMKRETYGYSYKNSVGQPAYYTHNYYNDNKHLLSIINLSAGYRYKLNNKFSFLAEPYFKMPIDGVGFGKIKLNSYGIMFTASVHPFN